MSAFHDAIAAVNAERDWSPYLRLMRNGYRMSDEDEAAFKSAFSRNWGRGPAASTAETHKQQARWFNSYLGAKCGRGPDAVKAAIDATLPDFPGITRNVAQDIVAGKRPKISALAKILRNNK